MKRPDIATPNSLFSASARYKAPVFQRLYVWGRTELEALEEDIDTSDSKIGQFLGAIVLKDLGRPSGPTSPSEYLIIDGQQRLTTIYLLFLALAHVAEKHGDKQSADFICKNYLVEVKSPQFSGWPKLIPTLQDRHSFWEILESNAPKVRWDFSSDPADRRPREAAKLVSQWKRILAYSESTVLDSRGELVKEAFSEVLQKIQDYLKLICITLEEHDDANSIFSRLNAKGIPLELSDLVRNEVFSKFGTQEGAKAERFYSKYWHPFEKSFPDGSLSPFFPIYAYVVSKGRVTKSAAFPHLQEKWKTLSPQEILEDFRKYSPFYCALNKYSTISGLSERLNAQVERFARMPRSRVTWPFIIEVLRARRDRRIEESNAAECLRIVESFLVRRSLAGFEPTGLHAVFKGLWGKTKGNLKDVLSSIVTRTIQCPDDAELKRVLNREASDSRVILRFVLEERERDYVKANKYDPPTAIATTIEHVLPQNLNSKWASLFSKGEHNKLVGMLGNLAPLSEMQNKSLRDQPWTDKRRRFKGSNFKSTQALAETDAWTPQIIRTRTKELADWVAKRWPSLDEFG